MKKSVVLLVGLLLFFVVSLVFVTTANADLIQYDITGLVSISGLSGVSVGDSWTAMFTVDTTTPDTSVNPLVGLYLMNSPFDLTIGSSFMRNYPQFRVTIADNTAFGDRWGIQANDTIFPFPDFVTIGLLDTTATVFNSNALPTSISLSEFDFTSMNFSVYNSATNIYDLEFAGTVTALTLTTIPEPSTLLLLGVGLAGVGLMRRKLRK